MPSKLRGVTQAMDMLRFNLEADAEKLMERVNDTDGRRATVFKDAHRELDQHDSDLREIDAYLNALEGSNGGPSSRGSSGSSGGDSKPPPAAGDATTPPAVPPAQDAAAPNGTGSTDQAAPDPGTPPPPAPSPIATDAAPVNLSVNGAVQG
ncbi:hypothetical protein [Bradyrhizobium sp. SZCCHNR2032]|uniref:hypothetical protein n=1 Tax=Bradyrhizobium sp. SZCCHNR2032 TaxID=3057384 RepID=UPI002916843B|nr:hypothetical protein [Bradyrhizobium sp. SZCCHNR2032]